MAGGRRPPRDPLRGDEYQIFLPGMDAAATGGAAETIRSFEREGTAIEPTLSPGVASYPEANPTADDPTRAADRALYRAKQAGGNAASE